MLSANVNLTGSVGLNHTNLTGSPNFQRINEEFGYRVVPLDANGDSYADVAVSAPAFQANGAEAGRLEVHHGAATGVDAAANWTYSGTPDAALGTGLTVGDYNNDGIDDLVASEGGAVPRRILFFFGNGSGLPSVPGMNLTFNGSGSYCYGCSLVGGTDLNGDGFDDLVAGTDAYGGQSGGRIDVYWGALGGLNLSNSTTLDRPDLSHYGSSLFSLGDTDNDGLAEFAAGVSTNQSEDGSIEVFEGVSATRAVTLRWSRVGDVREQLGTAADACDVTGDGVPDLLLGAPGNSTQNGRVHVFAGSGGATYPTAPATSMAPIENSSMYFGQSIACIGDLEGDGRDDVAVGAPRDLAATGRVYLYLGGNLTTSLSRALNGTVSSPVAFGSALNALGDVTDDGFPDFAVSLDRGLVGAIASGNVHAFYGRATLFPENLSVAVGSTQTWSQALRLDGTVRLPDISAEVQAYMAANQANATPGGFLDVPFNVTFNAGGRLRIDNLSVRSTVVLPPDPVSVYSPPAGSSLVVAWTPRGLDADIYSLWSNKTGSWQLVANISRQFSSFEDTNVVDGTTYWYYVTEWDSTVPFEGLPSQIVSGVPGDLSQPITPRALSAEADGAAHAVNLSWLPNEDDSVRYEVWRSDDGGVSYSQVSVVDVPGVGYRDTGLLEERSYWYRIRAQDDAGLYSLFTPPVEVTTPDVTAPAVPAGVAAAAVPNGTAVNVSWTANADDTQEYIVLRSTTGTAGTYVEVGRTVGLYLVNSGLARDTRYYFAVVAVDEVGIASAASASVSVFTEDTLAPDAPILLRADARASGNSIALEWSAVGDDLLRFTVYLESGGTWVANGLASPTQFNFNVTGLPDGVPASLRVTATDASGHESPPSNVLSAVPADTEAPAPPTTISAAVVTTGAALALSWSASASADVAGYRLFVEEGGAGIWSPLVSLPPGQLTFVHTPLINGVQYSYEVRPFDEVPNVATTGPRTQGVPKDTVAPSIPVGDALPALTNRETLYVTGTADPGADVEVLRGGAAVGAGTAGTDGRFNISVILVEGDNNLTLRATDTNATVDPQYHVGLPSAGRRVFLDRISPNVVSMSPSDGSQGAHEGEAVIVIFNEPLVWAAFGVNVTDAQGRRAAGALTVNETTRTATFVPDQPWASGQRYTVVLTGRDVAGNSLSKSVFNFTVGQPGIAGSGVPLWAVALIGVGVAMACAVLVMRNRKGPE